MKLYLLLIALFFFVSNLTSNSVVRGVCIVPALSEIIFESPIIVEGSLSIQDNAVFITVKSSLKGDTAIGSKHELRTDIEGCGKMLPDPTPDFEDSSFIVLGRVSSPNAIDLPLSSFSIWPLVASDKRNPIFKPASSLKSAKSLIEDIICYEKIAVDKGEEVLVQKLITDMKDPEKIFSILSFYDSYSEKCILNENLRRFVSYCLLRVLLTDKITDPSVVEYVISLFPRFPYSLALRYFQMALDSNSERSDQILRRARSILQKRNTIPSNNRINDGNELREELNLRLPEMQLRDAQNAIDFFDLFIPGSNQSVPEVLSITLGESIDLTDPEIYLRSYWEERLRQKKAGLTGSR